MVNKVFVSGSRSINSLTEEFKKEIDLEINKQSIFLVGDAFGVDLLTQEYLLTKNCKDVVVYHVDNVVRNNVGIFKTKSIPTPINLKSFKGKFTIRDNALASDCTNAICLWDNKSSGTKANINNVLKADKQIKILLQEQIMAMPPRKQRTRTNLDNWYNQKFGEPLNPSNPKAKPRMWFYVAEDPNEQTNGNPRIGLYLNNGGSENKQLTFNLDINQLMMFFQLIRKVCESEEPVKYPIQLKGHFTTGTYSEVPQTVGEIMIGRNGKGIVYFALKHGKNNPPAQFTFSPSEYWKILDETGEDNKIPFISTQHALAWATSMESQVLARMNSIQPTVPKEKNDAKGYGAPASGAASSFASSFDDFN